MEVGNQHPLLESVRMMELEKGLAQNGGGSLVLMSEEAASSVDGELSGLKGKWLARRKALVGKHSRIYQVAAFQPFSCRERGSGPAGLFLSIPSGSRGGVRGAAR